MSYNNRNLKEAVCVTSRAAPFDKQIIVGQHYMIDVNTIYTDSLDEITYCMVYTMNDKYVGNLILDHFEFINFELKK